MRTSSSTSSAAASVLRLLRRPRWLLWLPRIDLLLVGCCLERAISCGSRRVCWHRRLAGQTPWPSFCLPIGLGLLLHSIDHLWQLLVACLFCSLVVGVDIFGSVLRRWCAWILFWSTTIGTPGEMDGLGFSCKW